MASAHPQQGLSLYRKDCHLTLVVNHLHGRTKCQAPLDMTILNLTMAEIQHFTMKSSQQPQQVADRPSGKIQTTSQLKSTLQTNHDYASYGRQNRTLLFQVSLD